MYICLDQNQWWMIIKLKLTKNAKFSKFITRRITTLQASFQIDTKSKLSDWSKNSNFDCSIAPSIWKLFQDIMATETEIVLNSKASYEEKQKIWDYEPIANKNRVCTYNFRLAFNWFRALPDVNRASSSRESSLNSF